MSVVAIKDHNKLVRDVHSKAVLNTDRNALQEYYAKRDMIKKNKKKNQKQKCALPN